MIQDPLRLVHPSGRPCDLSFMEFPKMARLNREVVITEKIDGTNAQIIIGQRDGYEGDLPENLDDEATVRDGFIVLAASRTRLVTPGKQDNAGFAGWVKANRSELLKLGPGRHFGEWWGANIQRRYGLTEKRFSLFNVGRWVSVERTENLPGKPGVLDGNSGCLAGPSCCYAVPVIWGGNFDLFDCRSAVEMLRSHGSFAAPGFMDPEGIVIYHEAAKKCFKVTLEGDEKPKSVGTSTAVSPITS